MTPSQHPASAPSPARFNGAGLWYLFDLTGVAVFAISGALAGVHAGLDPFGVVVLAALPAIGGGTLRDLLMNRHPVFWLRDSRYLLVIVASALMSLLYARLGNPLHTALLVADALGLALFSLDGARLAEERGLHAGAVVVLGTMTGVAGGVLRDVVGNRVPLILQKDIYATAAIAGIVLQMLLRRMGCRHDLSFYAGMLAVAGLRLAALHYGWQPPVLLPSKG